MTAPLSWLLIYALAIVQMGMLTNFYISQHSLWSTIACVHKYPQNPSGLSQCGYPVIFLDYFNFVNRASQSQQCHLKRPSNLETLIPWALETETLIPGDLKGLAFSLRLETALTVKRVHSWHISWDQALDLFLVCGVWFYKCVLWQQVDSVTVWNGVQFKKAHYIPLISSGEKIPAHISKPTVSHFRKRICCARGLKTWEKLEYIFNDQIQDFLWEAGRGHKG